MGLILNIDTATETAYVNIAKDGAVLTEKENTTQKDHAAFVQPAILDITKNAGIRLNDLDAVAVAAGPGSYTGLRVGMASAKGLCYALQKPLITVNSLEILATAAKNAIGEIVIQNILFCPMIDARRMEVFSSVYDYEMNELTAPNALILDEKSFAEELAGHIIYFSGSGSIKWETLCNHANARFINAVNTSAAMALLSYKLFFRKQFAPLAASVPSYIKDFHAGPQ